MDPNIQRLQIAQTLVQGLLQLIPPSAHAKAQALLDSASASLQAIATTPPPSPLVPPIFTPPTT